MRKRIKYRKDGDILTSAVSFRGHRDGVYTVRLNLAEMTYEIKNVHQRRIIKRGGPYTSVVYLKRVANKALKSLGVDIRSEIRNI